jgi:hypothetical protein
MKYARRGGARSCLLSVFLLRGSFLFSMKSFRLLYDAFSCKLNMKSQTLRNEVKLRKREILDGREYGEQGEQGIQEQRFRRPLRRQKAAY